MAVSNQTFYWVGSNQAMIAAGNSFPAGSTYGTGFSGPWGFNSYYRNEFPYAATGDVYWGDKNNWMVKASGNTGGSGGTSGYFDDESGGDESGWYWTTADRTPHRGDHVVFDTISPDLARGLTFQAPLSPCLFGGRGNSGGYMWIGDISGDQVTTNTDAVEGLASMTIKKGYWNAGRSDGKIKNGVALPYGGNTYESGGFNVWGMRDLLAGVGADGLNWEGISVKSDAVVVQGTFLTNPDHTTGQSEDTVTPRHAVYFTDIENCNWVQMGMKEFYIYGGTCNNFYYGDYHGGSDTFQTSSGKYFDYYNGRVHGGRAEVVLSVLDTLRVTPTIFNALVDWKDPGGQCDTLVWGPKRVTGIGANNVDSGTFRYGSPSITKIDSYPFAGFGLTADSAGMYVSIGEDETDLGSGYEHPSLIATINGLELSGSSRFDSGSTGTDRINVTRLNMWQTNVMFPGTAAVGRNRYVHGTSDTLYDITGWNNPVKFAAGATVSTLTQLGGNVSISINHPGGFTWDSTSEDPGVRIDSLYRGPAGTIQNHTSEINAVHPNHPTFNHFIVGDPGSTSIEDGLQFIDSLPRLKTAFAQYLKVGPAPYGSTAAFASAFESEIGGKPGGGGGFPSP